MNLAFTEINETIDIPFSFDNRNIPEACRLVGGCHKAEVVLLCMLVRLTVLNQLLVRLMRTVNKEGLESIDLNHIYSLIPSIASGMGVANSQQSTRLAEGFIRGDRAVIKRLGLLVKQDYEKITKAGLNADSNNLLFDQMLGRDSVQRYKGKIERIENDGAVIIKISEPFYELDLFMKSARRSNEGGPPLVVGSEVELWPTGNATGDLSQAAFRLMGFTTRLERVENTSDANST